MKLTDPEFIRRLEMLAILARRVLGGDLKSDRRSRKKGGGTTFADYAEYNYGDDYRNIDWNIYARMESLVVKLFELEEDVTINILLDLSPSMAPKLDYAKKLAAALSYIALNNHDRLVLAGLADSVEPIMPPCHGRGKIFTMLETLEAASTFGSDTAISPCVRKFQMRQRKPGVCVIVSDFFSPCGFKEGIDCLRWARNDVFCLQTLDKSELSCEWRGDIELECVETKARRKITVGHEEARRYAEAVADWNQSIKDHCARTGSGFVSATTEIPFEEVIQGILRRGGLLA